jgi:NodT family efflux transporter outer membrane factor (OMF) lipoprotein
MKRIGILLAASTLLAGCPLPQPPSTDDVRQQALPNLQVPAQWTAGAVPAGEVGSGWLAQFNDPVLDSLVRDAIAYNPDLRVAAARVEAAEASARAAGAALYPQLNAAARGGGKMSGDNTGLEVIGLFASWELDLWGRVRAQRATAKAQYESTVLDAQYARESLAALVAKSWFLAREATLQRRIASEMVASSEDLAGLSRDRKRVGNADDYEVATADASLLGYRDLVLQADIARQNALRSVEILAGRYPAAALDPSAELPSPGAAIPAGLPSQLLERRPDVRAAERRVAATFYATQEAQAARLPKISLTASVNSVSSDLIVLKERNNPVWSVGGGILAPIFTGGALQAQVDVRTADQKAAVAEYARIGSRAFSEVENALAASFNLESRNEVLARSVVANESALGYARVRFDVGSGDLRGVQQQQLTLYGARTSLVHVQAERLIQRVNLYLALGGGFEAAK